MLQDFLDFFCNRKLKFKFGFENMHKKTGFCKIDH